MGASSRSFSLAAVATGLVLGAREYCFVTPPGARNNVQRVEVAESSRGPLPQTDAADSEAGSTFQAALTLLTLSAACTAGGTVAAKQLSKEGSSSRFGSESVSTSSRGLPPLRALPQVDWAGTRTEWGDIPSKSIWDVDWLSVHGVLSISAIILFIAQSIRIGVHMQPTALEAWITTAIYLPWIYFCWRDTEQLENHYRVTFYASCGWGVMSLASLHSVILQKQFPDVALGILILGNLVFAASCVYFYSYHWGRMWRHYQQNRFRPLWIPGLLGLMLLHGLTIADFAKRLDDSGWWNTVCQIYPDEWWWVADVRIIELFVTAAALWLIILHIQGVFTGMKNAAVVVVGTILIPLLVMVWESTWLQASAWQHYLMVGPKYW